MRRQFFTRCFQLTVAFTTIRKKKSISLEFIARKRDNRAFACSADFQSSDSCSWIHFKFIKQKNVGRNFSCFQVFTYIIFCKIFNKKNANNIIGNISVKRIISHAQLVQETVCENYLTINKTILLFCRGKQCDYFACIPIIPDES